MITDGVRAVSKERAKRRALREAEAARERAVATRRRERRARLRRLKPKLPRRPRTGRLFARRSRTERAGIVALCIVLLTVVWVFVDPIALRVALIALLVLVLPAVVVIAFGRRT
ncbi:hypothetical protein Pa4123_64410 [Phytohabitans aurantiacus]|uniref:DUF3040 domain-containing protein n=1 Tax=Phytohabitans aurantiacus TaxID=3016789 RepID=A0ABQ5R433_9ACTN|nr:hypothetical protein Pa4123_64410 [Phytohabitans aurantiacus]